MPDSRPAFAQWFGQEGFACAAGPVRVCAVRRTAEATKSETAQRIPLRGIEVQDDAVGLELDRTGPDPLVSYRLPPPMMKAARS